MGKTWDPPSIPEKQTNIARKIGKKMLFIFLFVVNVFVENT